MGDDGCKSGIPFSPHSPPHFLSSPILANICREAKGVNELRVQSSCSIHSLLAYWITFSQGRQTYSSVTQRGTPVHLHMQLCSVKGAVCFPLYCCTIFVFFFYFKFYGEPWWWWYQVLILMQPAFTRKVIHFFSFHGQYGGYIKAAMLQVFMASLKNNMNDLSLCLHRLWAKLQQVLVMIWI